MLCDPQLSQQSICSDTSRILHMQSVAGKARISSDGGVVQHDETEHEGYLSFLPCSSLVIYLLLVCWITKILSHLCSLCLNILQPCKSNLASQQANSLSITAKPLNPDMHSKVFVAIGVSACLSVRCCLHRHGECAEERNRQASACANISSKPISTSKATRCLSELLLQCVGGVQGPVSHNLYIAPLAIMLEMYNSACIDRLYSDALTFCQLFSRRRFITHCCNSHCSSLSAFLSSLVPLKQQQVCVR